MLVDNTKANAPVTRKFPNHQISSVINLTGHGVAYSGEPYATVLGEAADHVEHDAYLSGVVEVQAMPGNDVEEVADG